MDISTQYQEIPHTVKELISQQELANVLDARGFKNAGSWMSKMAMDLFKLNDINKIYSRHANLEGLQFVESLLSELQVNIELDENTLNKIPLTGGYVIVSNHPLGLLDGLILLRIFAKINPKTKILANHLLYRIENLRPFIIPVNPYESSQHAVNNGLALKSAMQHVKEGNPLIIFPAGEVSSLQKAWPAQITDSVWKTSIVKMVQKLGVPVLPVYLHAKNSLIFYMLAGMNPMLKSAAIPGEFLKSRGKSIKVIIGHAIQKELMDKCKNAAEVAILLKLKTYFLENTIQPSYLPTEKVENHEQVLNDKLLKKAVADEMKQFIQFNKILIENDRYLVVAGKTNGFTYIMKYLALAREITFRAVGEGTMQEYDTDAFDVYYEHLILWDRHNATIAGSYRMGFGSEIMQNMGMAGFYTRQLFHFDPKLTSTLRQSMEIGRSFMLKEYQQKPTTLLMLWKGIVAMAYERQNINYIFGAVSISNQYSNQSKSLIINMLSRHFKDPQIARHVKPKNSFEMKCPKWSDSLLAYYDEKDFRQYDFLVRDLENNARGIPVLIKKYLSLNALYAGCSVDPSFNNCLDALMFINIDALIKNPLFKMTTQVQ
ncbi:MAG: GNAT family N-acyltransferase [Saprospiraceae bacterium]